MKADHSANLLLDRSRQELAVVRLEAPTSRRNGAVWW